MRNHIMNNTKNFLRIKCWKNNILVLNWNMEIHIKCCKCLKMIKIYMSGKFMYLLKIKMKMLRNILNR